MNEAIKKTGANGNNRGDTRVPTESDKQSSSVTKIPILELDSVGLDVRLRSEL